MKAPFFQANALTKISSKKNVVLSDKIFHMKAAIYLLLFIQSSCFAAEFSGSQSDKTVVHSFEKDGDLILAESYTVPSGKSLILIGGGKIRPMESGKSVRLVIEGSLVIGNKNNPIPPEGNWNEIHAYSTVFIDLEKKQSSLSCERVLWKGGNWVIKSGKGNVTRSHFERLDLDLRDGMLNCTASTFDNLGLQCDFTPDKMPKHALFSYCVFFGDSSKISTLLLWSMDKCDIESRIFSLGNTTWSKCPPPPNKLYFADDEYPTLLNGFMGRVKGFKLQGLAKKAWTTSLGLSRN